jgi:hypothetical protein
MPVSNNGILFGLMISYGSPSPKPKYQRFNPVWVWGSETYLIDHIRHFQICKVNSFIAEKYLTITSERVIYL